MILSFEQHRNKTIRFEKLWRVDAALEDGTLVPLTNIKSAFGKSISADDGRKMANRIKLLVNSGLIEVDSEPIPMNIFLTIY